MASNETEARRRRVRQLWGKPDKAIAQILIEEGFKVSCGRAPKTKPAREEWEATRLDRMRRNVCNDREAWEKVWRQRTTVSGEEYSVAREAHIASLESDLEEIHELLDEAGTKPTAKAMLIGEKRQTRALLAKARGVEELAAPDPDAENKPKVLAVGLVLGTRSISPDTRQQLREQGVDIGDE